MRPLHFFVLFLLAILSLQSCSSSNKTKSNEQKKLTLVEKVYRADTITVIFDGPIQGEAVSFAKQLAGKWKVNMMRRQPKLDTEYLSGVTLEFDTLTHRFYGKAPCNKINGSFVINGFGIRFQNIASTRMSCDKLEQETYYLKLLNERISTYSIQGNTLLLRDGSANNVFECERIK
ncbi:MAG: META domain-containing protein [Sphingobacteriales bacterium]|nr:META domain-containing protein [Sphingobacteriales bacterium]